MADLNTAQRKMLAKMGLAMPDGSYPIRNGPVGASDLDNAIKAVGRGEAAGDSGAAIRKHIMARAAALKLTKDIPDTWNPDGSLKHTDAEILQFLATQSGQAFLEHFGVRGMHWGVRKSKGQNGPPSEDHANVTAIKAKVKKAGGIHTLSNQELRTLTDRLNLESNYHRLTEGEGAHIRNGEKFVKDNLGRVKLALEVADTAHKVYKTVNDVKSPAKK